MNETLVDQQVYDKWEIEYQKGSNKEYPSIDLVRLEHWFYGHKGEGAVLEYGFGTGVNAMHLIKCGYLVDAVDISPTAKTLLEKRIESVDGKDRLSLHLVDPTTNKLPFDDNSFDIVNCINVLSLLGSYEKVNLLLSEFKRVLKDNGKIIVDVNSTESDFARGSKYLGNDVYEFRGKSGKDSPNPCYCPASMQNFKQLIKQYFTIKDEGYNAYSYFGSEIKEYIICAENL